MGSADCRHIHYRFGIGFTLAEYLGTDSLDALVFVASAGSAAYRLDYSVGIWGMLPNRMAQFINGSNLAS